MVRVRFAPSPTGYLHVGGARTALFNWLLARASGGEFLLRIEDTDRARSSDEHTRTIIDGLRWLGLDWDGAVTFQADGTQRHAADAATLASSGQAYPCFCTPGELQKRREEARRQGGGFAYDGRCRRLPQAEVRGRIDAGQKHALRMRAPGEPVSWHDAVHGQMSFPAGSLDDFIILRSDGTPVYNLAVVSDDSTSGVTHVIRGDDHLSNTPKQIIIYRALGRALPVFGHVPMILGPDGKRLSKRHGALSVTAYRDEGYLPRAMLNFLALLGWSPGDDRELMSRSQLTDSFRLERVLKKSAVFDLSKLEWLNGRCIATAGAPELEPLVLDRLRETNGPAAGAASQRRAALHRIIDLVKERPRTVHALAAQVAPFFAVPATYEAAAVKKFWTRSAEAAELLGSLRDRLASTRPWSPDELETTVRGLAAERGIGAGRVINPLRLALMGQGVSPEIFGVLVAFGPGRTDERIGAALRYLQDAGSGAGE